MVASPLISFPTKLQPRCEMPAEMCAGLVTAQERFDLDRYDSNREARGHLAYGYGVHRCAGAHLAEVELRMLLDAVLRYDLQLDGDVSFAPTAHGAFLALTELPLRLTAPAVGDLLPR